MKLIQVNDIEGEIDVIGKKKKENRRERKWKYP